MSDYLTKLPLIFDLEEIHDDKMSGIISYTKKYQDDFTLRLSVDIYEHTASTTFYKKDYNTTIFNITFKYRIKDIICEENCIKFYTANNILLAELWLKPMVSLKLSF